MSQGRAETTSMVSIGMPVYNGERFIRKALDSLLSQTFPDFELIISDNASTDGTERVCRDYAARDHRIRFFRHNMNRGAAANFKFVLDAARYQYFMWAAYDDKWVENYLEDATKLLGDQSVDFIFPTFELQSIRLHVGRKFDREMFRFVESTDRRLRVLGFLALHHHSHKCNIVYSLFRAEFLRAAVMAQDIGNDGVLGAILLHFGRGNIISGSPFIKRYPMLWPGALRVLPVCFHKKMSKEFGLAKEAALQKLYALFPEYCEDIKAIYNHYQPYTHEKGYRICSIDAELANKKGQSW
jgi:glycosyltransferase involved in cell wall biosynthesis